MRAKKVYLWLLIAGMASVFFTQSCSKEENGSVPATDIALAQDEAYADALFEEVDNMVASEIEILDANGYNTSTLKSASEDVCFTVSVDHPDSTHFPKVVTIDYGTGCTIVFKDDTITRQGQIIVTVTDRRKRPGAQQIVNFNDFYLNGVKIEGNRTITNLGLNDKNHLLLGIELTNGKVIFNDTAYMTREASHVREIIRHIDAHNDTILVTGSANGINVLGETYMRQITEPLVMIHCELYKWRWVIASGVIEVTNSERGVTIIDYTGSGCDGKVIVNKNGYHHNYYFKYKNRYNKGGH